MTRAPAPPVDCGQCGRRIGARRVHFVAMTTTPRTVVCARCLGQKAHAAVHTDCPEVWHDMHDHPLSFASRAGVAWLLAQPTGEPA